MTAISNRGANNVCSDRRISLMLLGTTTTRVLGSARRGMAAGADEFDTRAAVVAASKKAPGGPYGK